jgi:hypothetical protein
MEAFAPPKPARPALDALGEFADVLQTLANLPLLPRPILELLLTGGDDWTPESAWRIQGRLAVWMRFFGWDDEHIRWSLLHPLLVGNRRVNEHLWPGRRKMTAFLLDHEPAAQTDGSVRLNLLDWARAQAKSDWPSLNKAECVDYLDSVEAIVRQHPWPRQQDRTDRDVLLGVIEIAREYATITPACPVLDVARLANCNEDTVCDRKHRPGALSRLQAAGWLRLLAPSGRKSDEDNADWSLAARYVVHVPSGATNPEEVLEDSVRASCLLRDGGTPLAHPAFHACMFGRSGHQILEALDEEEPRGPRALQRATGIALRTVNRKLAQLAEIVVNHNGKYTRPTLPDLMSALDEAVAHSEALKKSRAREQRAVRNRTNFGGAQLRRKAEHDPALKAALENGEVEPVNSRWADVIDSNGERTRVAISDLLAETYTASEVASIDVERSEGIPVPLTAYRTGEQRDAEAELRGVGDPATVESEIEERAARREAASSAVESVGFDVASFLVTETEQFLTHRTEEVSCSLSA